jgi:hypothetical protein
MRPRGLYIEKSVRTVRSVMVGYRHPLGSENQGNRGDHCGSQFGDMRLWNWPPDCPTRQIWLHERCEALARQPWMRAGNDGR